MKKLNGKNIMLNIHGLVKVRDLINYETPLLSHFINDIGENYIFYWLDVDMLINKWLVFKTDINTINLYLNGNLTLYDLIKMAPDGYGYIIDIDNNSNYSNIEQIQIKNLDKSFFPSQDSFYEFNEIQSGELVVA